ncbi:MAG: NAD(P)H-dependent glycerol-3-phosphate dehydrogenase [Lachnospiraceae bacterium]|nr:NAD(P)H-dependent glycerol-3-phosphate dehydrogenase [Lachnospiraceae bacterium]
MKAFVIGCGRWGTFISWYLDLIGHEVTLYGRSSSAHMQTLLRTRRNAYLELSDRERLTTELSEAADADALFISVNSQGLRSLCGELNGLTLSGKTIVLCMKGIEIATGKRLSAVVEETLRSKVTVCVWLGPGHVQEYVKGHPNCMVIDSDSPEAKARLTAELSGELIRFYYGTDLIGNEIGAAAKNVIGLAAGMLDGLGLSSLKGALMARGTREVSRLIEAKGGDPISAYGLCHLGDYEATVFSEFSHNRRYGENFVLGKESEGLAEGVETAKAIHFMTLECGVDMPICEAVYSILFEHADPRSKLDELFERSLKAEF